MDQDPPATIPVHKVAHPLSVKVITAPSVDPVPAKVGIVGTTAPLIGLVIVAVPALGVITKVDAAQV